MRYIILLMLLLGTSCAKEELICGTIDGGGIDRYTNMYYLSINKKRIWVDMKTYESYYIGDYECFEDW